MWLRGSNGAEHDGADGGRENVLRSDLNDAGSIGPQGCQQYTEIQVMSENDPAVRGCEIEDLRVCSPRLTNLRPVDCLESLIGQEAKPQRAQVHVDQEFHAADSGTSISSTRHAAYDNACRMSSSSR